MQSLRAAGLHLIELESGRLRRQLMSKMTSSATFEPASLFRYGNASLPLWINHITLVSVTTEANVPISTATDAGSIQVLFCRAMTNTLSAGGNDGHQHRGRRPGLCERPEQQHQAEHDQRMDQEFDRDHAGHLPGHAIERAQRDCDTQHEQRRRRRGVLQECSVLSIATGGRKCSAAASAPAPADMISGFSTICRTTMPNVCSSERARDR